MVESSKNFGFVTPVQFIAQMLVDLRLKYFADDSEEHDQIRRNIGYSLDKLNNKSSLFQVDPDLTKEKKSEKLMNKIEDGMSKILEKKYPDL